MNLKVLVFFYLTDLWGAGRRWGRETVRETEGLKVCVVTGRRTAERGDEGDRVCDLRFLISGREERKLWPEREGEGWCSGGLGSKPERKKWGGNAGLALLLLYLLAPPALLLLFVFQSF